MRVCVIAACFVLAACSDARPRGDSGAAPDAPSASCQGDAECAGGRVCRDGACVCPEGTNLCAGECVTDDLAHCGPSCAVCEASGGEAACVAGACVVSCPEESASCASGCCAWERHDAPVDDVEGGRGPSLAVDGDYGVHIAHRGRVFSGPRVRYHYFDGASWALRFAASAPNSNWQTSLALAPDGSTRVAFGVYNSDNSVTVQVARVTDGPSEYDVLEESGRHGTPAALRIDGAGTAHLVWQSFTSPSDSLTYSTRTVGGAWVHERVEAAGDASWSADLHLDSRGEPHVAYPYAGDGVYHAARSAGTWTVEQVAGDPSIATVALAIDAGDVVHLAYFQEESDDLRYAVRGVAGWTEEIVDAEGDVGWHPCMSLDAAGRAHVAYFDRGTGALRYARQLGPGAWERAVVDDGPDADGPCAIAVDDRGRRHLAYRDAGFNNLVYATLPP